PYHSATSYIAKLVRKGYRVAICEQLEAPGKGIKLVRREVVRVITPGTAIDSQLLDGRENSYLAAITGSGAAMAAAFVDVSTGEFITTEFPGEQGWERLVQEIEKFGPREILYPNSLAPLLSRSSAGKDSPALFAGALTTPLED